MIYMMSWKGLIIMKMRKNVSNREIANSLLESLSYNDNALDYIKNQIYRTENILNYKPEDKEIQEQLKIEKYIEFVLKFTEDSYKKSLKKVGVKV